MPTLDFAKRLPEKAGVAVSPGVGFAESDETLHNVIPLASSQGR